VNQQMTIEQAVGLAIQHHTAGQLQEAEQIYRQVLAVAPNHPDALHLLGVIALQAGRADVAIDFINRAIAVRPAAGFYSNLSEAYRKSGRFGEAESSARRSIALDPRNAPAHANLGATLADQEKYDEAETELRAVLEIDPNLSIALTNLGNVCKAKGRLDEAIELGRRSIALDPNNALGHNNLGASLEKKELPVEAEAEYRKAIQLDPRRPEVYVNLGNLLYQQHHHDDALRIWEQAIAVDAKHDNAHWNIALALLARGDFERGWPMHERRFKCTDSRKYLRSYDMPLWTGFDLAGKTILLYPEQGYGDVVMFARFAAPLAERGAKVILHMPTELIELMRGVDGVENVFGPKDELPPFDTHLPLLSVPAVLHTTMKTLPAKVPYAHVDAERKRQWASRIVSPEGNKKVGLVFRGRAVPDPRRSCPFTALLPLADIPGVTFFSLQMGEGAAELSAAPSHMRLIDVHEPIHDFADTAAAIANLDLLITIDTAAAHVAGAIGAPVWTMLPFAADYRWMHDRDDSPWYPTMKLFRQSKRNDWSDVVGRIKDELSK
jgi:tetratricopeptide (TPR) repeat protein